MQFLLFAATNFGGENPIPPPVFLRSCARVILPLQQENSSARCVWSRHKKHYCFCKILLWVVPFLYLLLLFVSRILLLYKFYHRSHLLFLIQDQKVVIYFFPISAQRNKETQYLKTHPVLLDQQTISLFLNA